MHEVFDTSDEGAWKQFYDSYAGIVYSIARSKGLCHEDAEDVVQEVFCDYVRKCEYDKTKGCFRAYLVRLVNWRVMDRLKLARRDADLKVNYWEEMKAVGLLGDSYTAEHERQMTAMEEALRRMKSTVRSEHYAAFVASAVEGQDTETVMKLYGLSRDNLYQIRTRLIAKLRETAAEIFAEMDSSGAPNPRP